MGIKKYNRNYFYGCKEGQEAAPKNPEAASLIDLILCAQNPPLTSVAVEYDVLVSN